VQAHRIAPGAHIFAAAIYKENESTTTGNKKRDFVTSPDPLLAPGRLPDE
jgi:hypothetical protein